MSDDYFDDDYFEDEDDYYEDEEMPAKETPVENIEVGLKALRSFVLSNQNKLIFNLLMQRGDDIIHVEYTQQPCYGELRPYAKTHPDMLPEHQRKVQKPGDLHSPFPDGTPVAVAVPFYNQPNGVTTEQYNRIVNLVLDPGLSPWREALKDFEVLKNEDGRIAGIIIKDTNIDSTVMVNLFMTLRGASWGSFYKVLTNLLEKFPEEDPYLLLAAATQYGPSWDSGQKNMVNASFAYYISPALNVKNFLRGEFGKDITGGTFRDRYAYNRPDLHNVFGENAKTWQAVAKEKFGRLNLEPEELIDLLKSA